MNQSKIVANQSEIDMKEKFIAFLKKRRVYKRFIANCKNLSFDELIEDNIKENSPKSIIGGGFIWSDSFEDHKYWDNINRSWLKELEKDPS